MTSMFEGIKAKKELPEGVGSLEAKRSRDESIKAMTAAMDPLGSMRDGIGNPEKEAEFASAAGLMDAFWRVIWETEEFKAEWYRAVDDGLDTLQQQMLILEWMDGLYLAIGRHVEDVPALVHEWHLVFTERPVASRAWSRMTIGQRRDILAAWRDAAASYEPPS
jgi:hypothetical protein